MEDRMIAVGQLRGQIKGRVIEARDPEYDDARKVFVGGVDRRPALIVRVVDSSDVAAVIAFARETGLDLAVRSGGHSWSGDCVADGGIVIDLRDMRAVTIDDAGRMAECSSSPRPSGPSPPSSPRRGPRRRRPPPPDT